MPGVLGLANGTRPHELSFSARIPYSDLAPPVGFIAVSGYSGRFVRLVRPFIGNALVEVSTFLQDWFPEEETTSPHGGSGASAKSLRQLCCASAHSGSFPDYYGLC